MHTIRKFSRLMLISLLITSVIPGFLFQIPKVKASPEPLTGKIYDEGVDTNSNGLYDFLRIGVEINVTQPGYYSIYADGLTNGTFHNSTGVIYVNVWDYSNTYLDTGMQVVNLSFFGPTIYTSRILNASHVNRIELSYPYGPPEVSYDVPLSKMYSYYQFDFHALLTGKVNDIGVDTDEDGDYNYLQVSVEINVSNPGDYSISAYGLVNGYPNWTCIDVSARGNALLESGLQEINVTFPGARIYISNLNFSMVNSISLREIWQGPEGRWKEWNLDWKGSVPLSREYSYQEFEALAKLTGNIRDEGVDTDKDGHHDYLRVGVEVEVFEPATYEISAWSLANITLPVPGSNASRGTISIGDNVYQYLDIGLNVVNMSFYGPVIYASGIDPSVVVNIDLYSTSPEWIHLGSMYDTHLNKTYLHTEFDARAYLTGKVFDKAVDTDQSGKGDYLEVSVEVQVEDSGYYEVNVEGLTDETGKGTYYESFYPTYNRSYLETGTRVINFCFYGPRIAAYKFNPRTITRVTLSETYRPSYPPIRYYYWVQTLTNVSLSRQYLYTEFDAPFRDMEAKFVVYPNGSVVMGGSLNYTHMEYPNQGPQLEQSLAIEKNGELTVVSTNGKVVLPKVTNYPYWYPYYYQLSQSQWPYNSTVVSALAKYSEGKLNAGVNASSVLPSGLASQYPFNSSDCNLNMAYLNGILNGEIDGSTTLPSQATSMFPFNVTDFSLKADYSGGNLKGNVTFHMLSGFPLGDLTLDLQANRTDITGSGSVTVIYGTYPSYPQPIVIDEAFVNNLIGNITVFEGRGPESLYNKTNGLIEFLDTSTITKIPQGSTGATVTFDVVFHGDFVGFLAFLLSGQPFSPQYEAWYDLIDSAIASVHSASIQLAYSKASATASLKITFEDDLKLLMKDIVTFANYTIINSYPDYMLSYARLQLYMMNATFNSIESFNLQLSYSSSTKTIDLKLSIVDNLKQLWDDAKKIIIENVPPELRTLFEKLLNTTYCNVKSAEASLTYEKGEADSQATVTIEGDFNKEINYIKNVYITTMEESYKNSSIPVPWQLYYINQTQIDASNLKIYFNQTATSTYESFEGLFVSASNEPIDATSFKLYRFFNLTSSPYENPRSGERLKLTVQGGYNGTNIVTLIRPATVPVPDYVSDDKTVMIWNNQSISTLKNLVFSLQYHTSVAWNGQTYSVITASNGTVSPVTFDQPYMQLSLTIDGPTGKVGYANITIPKALLYAPKEDWIIVVDGKTISWPDYTVTETDTTTTLYFTFTFESPVQIQIKGTVVVPEFPTHSLLTIFLVTTLITVVVQKITSKIRRKRVYNRLDESRAVSYPL